MNSGHTTERVYDALKEELLSGTIAPGEKLEPASLASAMSSSVTPVRDALHRLTGERLVETRTSEGFYLPHVHEPALRDLYGWNGQLLRMIIRAWPKSRNLALPGVRIGSAQLLFAEVAVQSDNAEHAAQVAAANDRLSAPRAAEAQILIQTDDELSALAAAFRADDRSALAKQMAAYHRRRLQAVPEIVRALYRG